MRCPFITSRGYIPPLSSAGFAGAIDVLGEASEGAAEAPSDASPRTSSAPAKPALESGGIYPREVMNDTA